MEYGRPPASVEPLPSSPLHPPLQDESGEAPPPESWPLAHHSDETTSDSLNDQYADQLDRVEETGDPDAFWEVAARFYPEITQAAKSMMHSYRGWLRDVSYEDVVNDAIIKVYKRIERVRGQGGEARYPRPQIEYFVSAIGSVIKDNAKCLNTQRTVPKGELVAQDDVSAVSWREIVHDGADAFAQYEDGEITLTALQKIVSQLSERQRGPALEYLAKKAYGSLGPEETDDIAKKYGTTPSAIKAMVYRLRQKGIALHAAGAITLPTDVS